MVDGLDDLSFPELRELAKQHDIVVPVGTTKASLVEQLASVLAD